MTATPAHPDTAVDYADQPHPRTVDHLVHHRPKPVKVDDERTGLNGKIGLAITVGVGTMVCAYVFAGIALVSLPDTLKQVGLNIGFTFGTGTILLVAWISQAFLQLVLLPIIIVGQNIQARAADKRAEETYKDAVAVLHECRQIQKHLIAQDQALTQLLHGQGGAGAPAAG
jgi:hypothetical protein